MISIVSAIAAIVISVLLSGLISTVIAGTALKKLVEADSAFTDSIIEAIKMLERKLQ